MKELNKEEIHQIAYNCRKATFLIEKKQIGTLTLREKLELQVHLAGCSVCRIFEKQSITINRVVKNLFNEPQPGLNEDFKKNLDEKIKQKLNNDDILKKTHHPLS